MKIVVRYNEDFDTYDIIEVVNREEIVKELEKLGVNKVVAGEVLEAYLDELRGEATVFQSELLGRQPPEAINFLCSITEKVEKLG